MAQRPWITPYEVQEYSTNPEVQSRTHARLLVDIARAEQYIISYCQHDFSDDERYPEIPESVKTAALLTAEFYAAQAEAEASGRSLLKSETNDDYSYTAQDTKTAIDNLTIGPLLDPFIEQAPRHGIRMDAHIW